MKAEKDQAPLPPSSNMSGVNLVTSLLCVLWWVAVSVSGRPTPTDSTVPNQQCRHPLYPQRLGPLPVPGPPSTKPWVVFNSSTVSSTQLMTLQSLQGAVARTAPQLFEVGDPGDTKTWWFNDLVANHGVSAPATASSFQDVITTFHASVSGYVLTDVSKPATVTAALSYAAAASPPLMVVDVSDQATVNSLKVVAQKADATSGAITDASVLAAHPLTGPRARTVILQSPAKYQFLTDVAVSGGLFTFWDSSGSLPSPVSNAVLSQLQAPAAVLGWGPTEGDTVGRLSKYGSYIHAADFAPNLSGLSAFTAGCLVQPNHVSSKPTVPSAPAAATPKHTVTFLFTDGDNWQWLLGPFASSPSWYGSPQRGSVPLGWTISPALAEGAPTVMQYLYAHATPDDTFVAGPSGVGYFYPESLPSPPSNGSLASLANLTATMMSKSDLSIVNVLANENCHPQCTTPYLASPLVDAEFLYFGDAYVGGNGAVWWDGNKPIVTGRTAFWQGFNTAETLAQKLRLLPKEPANPDSYSVIPVHVWSRNVSDVVETVKLLGEGSFDVVGPAELVSRLKSTAAPDCSAPAATGSFSESCHVGSSSCGVLNDVTCPDGNGQVLPTPYFRYASCPNSVVNNCGGRLVCAGQPCPSSYHVPTGSFATSCSKCATVGGFLVGCDCGGGQTQARFDYTACSQFAVANCYGALVCQGEPCS